MSSPTFLTGICNDLSRTAVVSSIYAAVGYFGAIAAKQIYEIDPKTAMACGVTAGAIMGLMNGEKSNRESKIIALAGLILIPFQVCQKLDLPVPFKAALAVTGAIVPVGYAADLLFHKVLRKIY